MSRTSGSALRCSTCMVRQKKHAPAGSAPRDPRSRTPRASAELWHRRRKVVCTPGHKPNYSPPASAAGYDGWPCVLRDTTSEILKAGSPPVGGGPRADRFGTNSRISYHRSQQRSGNVRPKRIHVHCFQAAEIATNIGGSANMTGTIKPRLSVRRSKSRRHLPQEPTPNSLRRQLDIAPVMPLRIRARPGAS